MKLITLVRLLITFISNRGLYNDFIEEIEHQGYTEEEINILTDK